MAELKTYKESWEDENLYVHIKCNVCGEVHCYFPHLVMYSPECKCGNKDSGDCVRDWPKGLFGKFTVVEAYIWNISHIWSISPGMNKGD